MRLHFGSRLKWVGILTMFAKNTLNWEKPTSIVSWILFSLDRSFSSCKRWRTFSVSSNQDRTSLIKFPICPIQLWASSSWRKRRRRISKPHLIGNRSATEGQVVVLCLSGVPFFKNPAKGNTVLPLFSTSAPQHELQNSLTEAHNVATLTISVLSFTNRKISAQHFSKSSI